MSKGLDPGQPLVSVVIPAFNAGRFLDAAIDSVMQQTYPSIECVVVDDGSTDDTAEVATRYPRVKYLKKVNGGDASARNFGVQNAQADLFAFLDADDLWLPRKLELQMEILRERPDVCMVYSGIHIVDEQLGFLGKMSPAGALEALRNTLLFEKPYMTGIGSTCVVRREIFFTVGGFDERLRASADWAFGCKVASIGPVERVDRPLALYRQHGSGQVHSNLVAVERDVRTVFEEGFADGGFVPQELRDQRSRGEANLMLSLAAGWWRRGDRLRATRYAARAVLLSPARFLAAFRRRMLPPVG